MDASAKWNYLKILGLTALAAIVFFPDVFFDLTTTSLHYLFEWLLELSHLLFEGLESVLDHLIEGLFETDLHSTQTIVFYIIVAIFAYPLYWLGRSFYRTFRRCQQAWQHLWAEHQFNPIEYWRGLSLFGKIKLVLIPSAVIYLYVMFFV